jgi:translation initiation factor 2B subunit (eIF-2B alpha/beta/delta family)
MVKKSYKTAGRKQDRYLKKAKIHADSKSVEKVFKKAYQKSNKLKVLINC